MDRGNQRQDMENDDVGARITRLCRCQQWKARRTIMAEWVETSIKLILAAANEVGALITSPADCHSVWRSARCNFDAQ